MFSSQNTILNAKTQNNQDETSLNKANFDVISGTALLMDGHTSTSLSTSANERTPLSFSELCEGCGFGEIHYGSPQRAVKYIVRAKEGWNEE